MSVARLVGYATSRRDPPARRSGSGERLPNAGSLKHNWDTGLCAVTSLLFRHDQLDFVSDLMSMPWPFAWLVPGTGKHIPAVLLHDGLVVALDDDGEHGSWTHVGAAVTREQADYILREAMYTEGTTFLRRWLMWTGVMLGTMWATFTPRPYWRTMMLLNVLTIAVFGIGATMDLFDRSQELGFVDWFWNLPWMGDRVWFVELLAASWVRSGSPSLDPLCSSRSMSRQIRRDANLTHRRQR